MYSSQDSGSPLKNISKQAQNAQEASNDGENSYKNVETKIDDITKAVSETSSRISNLAKLSDDITNILGTIKKISSQKKLLTLNATIEAARAGEAGKGFAVVANEVKALSGQTTKATEEISAIIEDLRQEMSSITHSMERSSEAVNDGRNSINDLSQKIHLIREKIESVTNDTKNISTTLQEQAIATNEVSSGISTIAQSSQESVEGIEKIVDSMSSVEKLISSQITDLAKLGIPGKIIKLAQSDHVLWKKRLANMIAGKEGLNQDELADHHSCRLGKWYDSVDNPNYLNHKDFINLATPHEQVHLHGIKAVKFFNEGDTQAALAEIDKVEQSSIEVLNT